MALTAGAMRVQVKSTWMANWLPILTHMEVELSSRLPEPATLEGSPQLLAIMAT